jgi:predicted dehydrogenase
MRVRLAVQGAGLIGRRHAAFVQESDQASLCAIIDPAPSSEAYAAEQGCPWFADFASMLAMMVPDGVIIATPTPMHVAHGLACVAAGIPVLVEKPVADDVAGASRLVEAAGSAGVPLLVGHHRRHNSLVQAARRAIDAGEIGEIVAVHGICWFAKPDSYFEPDWRRAKGAGPVLTNLIHDVDLLRALCGDVVAVQAMESKRLRGHPVEETAVILLRFESGVLGTLTVSDTIASPWSWEFTSGENPDYTQTAESCYQIGGTKGSLSVPYLDVWSHDQAPEWWTPIGRTRLAHEASLPLANQIRNFCGVIRGTEAPVVSGREGLATLRVIAAIKQAAETGALVSL